MLSFLHLTTKFLAHTLRFSALGAVVLSIASCADLHPTPTDGNESVKSGVVTPVYSDLWGKSGEKWSPQSRLPDFSFAGYRAGQENIPSPPEVANVRTFGAVGNGVTDDTQAFLNAIASASNGAVVVPAGRYKITQVLKITKPNVVLRGAGSGSTTLLFPKSLTEVLGSSPAWAGGGPWAFAGGFLWLEGKDNGAKLADVTGSALRGAKSVTVNTTAGISVGSTIRIVEYNNDGSLGRFLHADQADAGSSALKKLVDFAVKVVSISNNVLTFDRPLRADVRSAWSPQIYAFAPTVRETGVEGLTLEFPNTTYPGHLVEKGYNAIYLDGVANAWIRDVTILDADSGVLTSPQADQVSRFWTIDRVRLANQWRPSSGLTGHHGIALEGPQDVLVSNFDIAKQFFHDVTVDWAASGNVFSSGKAVNMNLDHHRSVPYENLFTDIDVGAGDTLWIGSRDQDSGQVSDGPISGARETLWNIRASNAGSLPNWPQLNVIGMTRYATSKSGNFWVEQIDPAALTPSNIYQAQVAARQSSSAPVPATIELTPGSVTLSPSATQQFVVKAYDQSHNLIDPSPTFSWTTNGGTVSDSGLYTAGSTAGTFTVTASSAGKDGTTTVTNSGPAAQVLTSVTVTPSTASMNPSSSLQFSARAFDQNGSPMSAQPTFNWTATGGSVNASGLYSAGATAGSYVVTATASGKTGSANVSVASSSGSVALTSVADAYVRDGDYANTNYGSTSSLEAKTDSVNWSRTDLIRFDLSSVSGVVNGAKLRLYGKISGTDPQLTISAFSVASPNNWSETTVNWNNQPAAVSTLSSRTVSGSTATWYEWDVTSYVKSEKSAGRTSVSIGVRSDVQSATFATFSSKEASGGNAPQLLLTLGSDPPPSNQAPTIATAASATPSPVSTVGLSALGTDDGGESNLKYTWTTTGTSPAAVSFSANGSNAAKSTTATFAKAGSYAFRVTITDASGATVTSSVNVNVSPITSSVVVTPANVTTAPNTTVQYTASAKDQFGSDVTSTSFTWATSGGGTISGGGLFTAGSQAGGPFTVTASSGGKSGSANVSISGGSSSVVLLAQADALVRDGSYAANNYGAQTTLEVKNHDLSWSRVGFLKFDLSAVPNTITTVKLRLFGYLSYSDPLAIQVFSVANTSWSESQLTWNSKPAVGDLLAQTLVSGTSQQWWEWDITNFVAAERRAGRTLVSLSLQGAAYNATYFIASSKEASSSEAPRLIVTSG